MASAAWSVIDRPSVCASLPLWVSKNALDSATQAARSWSIFGSSTPEYMDARSQRTPSAPVFLSVMVVYLFPARSKERRRIVAAARATVNIGNMIPSARREDHARRTGGKSRHRCRRRDRAGHQEGERPFAAPLADRASRW